MVLIDSVIEYQPKQNPFIGMNIAAHNLALYNSYV